ncbi:MAG: hypothetical protein AAF236_03440 [Verrucomicrobiota bacterium]
METTFLEAGLTVMDQEFFPGKFLVWLLVVLSVLGWVLILNVSLNRLRLKRADRAFTRRLQNSAETLEAYEEGRSFEPSPRQEIYNRAAAEVGLQLLGHRSQVGLCHRVREAGRLSESQFRMVCEALDSQLSEVNAALQRELLSLRMVGLFAGIIGLVGFAWSLIGGFLSGEPATLQASIFGGLAYIVFAIAVMVPAVIAELLFFLNQRGISRRLQKFRDEMAKLFHRTLADHAPPVEAPLPSVDTPAEAEPQMPTQPVEQAPRRRYISVRDRLFSPDDRDPESDLRSRYAPPINPIARQAAEALRNFS